MLVVRKNKTRRDEKRQGKTTQSSFSPRTAAPLPPFKYSPQPRHCPSSAHPPQAAIGLLTYRFETPVRANRVAPRPTPSHHARDAHTPSQIPHPCSTPEWSPPITPGTSTLAQGWHVPRACAPRRYARLAEQTSRERRPWRRLGRVKAPWRARSRLVGRAADVSHGGERRCGCVVGEDSPHAYVDMT